MAGELEAEGKEEEEKGEEEKMEKKEREKQEREGAGGGGAEGEGGEGVTKEGRGRESGEGKPRRGVGAHLRRDVPITLVGLHRSMTLARLPQELPKLLGLVFLTNPLYCRWGTRGGS